MNSHLIDAHLHLQDDRFTQNTIGPVIDKAIVAGVVKLFCNATSEDDWQNVVLLSKKYAAIKPFLGVHPWFSQSTKDGWLRRLEVILDSAGAGVGEIGIDKVSSAPYNIQEKVFISQLELAFKNKLPVSIHCVKKWGKLLDILKRYAPFKQNIMIHSFSGSTEIMHQLVELGIFISFSCQLACPQKHKLREVFQKTPLKNILLETDAPDQFCPELFSDTHNVQKKNQPAYIVDLYTFAADLLNFDRNQFIKEIWNNGKIFTN